MVGLDPSAGMLAKAERENPYKRIIEEYFVVGTAKEHSKCYEILCSFNSSSIHSKILYNFYKN